MNPAFETALEKAIVKEIELIRDNMERGVLTDPEYRRQAGRAQAFRQVVDTILPEIRKQLNDQR